jgi:hypothetical protein
MMKVKHIVEKVVSPPDLGPLDLSNAAEEAMSDLLVPYYEDYNFTKPMTITVSIEGETW